MCVCVCVREREISREKAPDMEEVFDGRETKLPERSDVVYAVVSSMVAYAKDHRYERKSSPSL